MKIVVDRFWPVVRVAAKAFEIVGMAMVGLMAVHVTVDVAMRGLLNQPIQGTLEVMTYWYMVGISFVGLWLAQVKFEHISVTMISARLAPASRRVIDVATGLITAVFLLAMGWYSLQYGLEYLAEREFVGAYRIPIWPMRFVVVVGLFACASTLAYQMTTRQQPHEEFDELTTEDEVSRRV